MNAIFKIIKDSIDCEFMFNGIIIRDYEISAENINCRIKEMRVGLTSVHIKDVFVDVLSLDSKEEKSGISRRKESIKVQKNESSAEQGIDEMGRVFQRMIKSIEVNVENIKITVGGLIIDIERISLETKDIPLELQMEENILSNFIKYFLFQGISARFKDEKILQISKSYVRVAVLQSLDESVHHATEFVRDPAEMMETFLKDTPQGISSSVKDSLHEFTDGLKESFLNADMSFKVLVLDCDLIIDAKFVSEIEVDIQNLRKTANDGFAEKSSKEGSSNINFELVLEKAKLILLPHDYNSDAGARNILFNDYDSYTGDYMLVNVQMVTVRNINDEFINSILVECEELILSEHRLNAKSIISNIRKADVGSCISIRLVKMGAGNSRIFVTVPELKTEINFKDMLAWNKYIPVNSNMPKKKKNSNSFVNLECLIENFDVQINLSLDSTAYFAVRINGIGGIISVGNSLLISNGDSVYRIDMENAQINICTGNLESCICKLFNISIDIHISNHADIVGIDENFVKGKHSLLRDHEFNDQESSTSWDFEEVKTKSPENPKISKTNNMELDSKISINMTVKEILTELSSKDLDTLNQIANNIQKLTLDRTLESEQPPIKLYLTANKFIFSGDFEVNHISHCFDAKVTELEFFLALNSISEGTNFILSEISCSEIHLEANQEESNIVLIETRLGDHQKQDMINLIISIEDDSNLNLRQVGLTLKFSNVLVNIPNEFPSLPTMGNETSLAGDITSTSIDLAVLIRNTDFQIENSAQKLLLEIEHAKIATIILVGSPIKSIEITCSGASCYFSNGLNLDEAVPENIRSLCLLQNGYVNIANLNGLEIKFSENKNLQAYPSIDVLIDLNELQLLFCADSMFRTYEFITNWLTSYVLLMRFLSSPKNSIDSSVDAKDFNLPLNALDTFDLVEEVAFSSSNLETVLDNHDWQMDFDYAFSKEEKINESIKLFGGFGNPVVQNYLDSLKPIKKLEDNESVDIKFRFLCNSISIQLFDGHDFDIFDKTVVQRDSHQVELLFQKIHLKVFFYPPNSVLTKSVKFEIEEIEILDNVKTSKWNKFLAYQIPSPEEYPRVTGSKMVSILWSGVRGSGNEEFRLKFKLLPVQMFVDQDTLFFLESFFGSSADIGHETASDSTQMNPDTTFFQLVEISSISVQVDYKPKKVDLHSISKGHLSELINFLHLEGARIYLKPVKVAGVHGWHRLINLVVDTWLPHVKQTQIPQMAAGLPVVKSIVNVGGGISDLILLPIEQYKKNGRLMQGISRGANSFLKAATVETTRIGSQLATGAQNLIENAEAGMGISNNSTNVSKLSNQPKDLKEGVQIGLRTISKSVQDAAKVWKAGEQAGEAQVQTVPLAMLQPVKGMAMAFAQAMVGIHNTLDHTQQRRMRDKYKLQ